MRFIRKVIDSKWPDYYQEGEDIQANCLNDLRITENALSIWLIKDDEDALLVASLLAANADNDPKAKNRFVVFSDQELKEKNIKFEPRDCGCDIRIGVKNAKHYDLYDLKLKTVESFAHIVAKKYANHSVIVINKKDILRVLSQSFNNNEFDIRSIKSDTFRNNILSFKNP